MAYPKALDLEAVADLITSRRSAQERIEIDGRVIPAPLRRFASLKPAVQARYNKVLSANFFIVPPKRVHVYNRGKRLGRLEEGIYRVAVPGGDEFMLADWQVSVPGVEAQVQHRRVGQNKVAYRGASPTPAPVQGFQIKEWEPTSIEMELEDPATQLQGLEAATIYSELIVSLPMLQGWDEAEEAYNQWYTAVFEPFINGIEGRAATADSPGELQELEEALEKNKQDFVAEHKETIFNYIMLTELLGILHDRALDHFYTQYSLLIHGRVTSNSFPRPTSFALDASGRILWKRGTIHQPTLYLDQGDLERAPLEALPFDGDFHDKFQEKLLGSHRQLKGYEKHAEDLLIYAEELSHMGRYASAVVQAEAAFEVALYGFLEDNNVDRFVGGDGQMSLRTMTGNLFDKAVHHARVAAYEKNVFDPRILQKILRMNGCGEKVLHDLRNRIIHHGEHEQVTPEIAQLACLVYSEAIQYIQEHGWDRHGAPLLTSDVVLAVTPALRDYMPNRVRNNVDAIVSKAARELKYKMGDAERDRYDEISLPRWARESFRR